MNMEKLKLLPEKLKNNPLEPLDQDEKDYLTFIVKTDIIELSKKKYRKWPEILNEYKKLSDIFEV